MSDYTRSDIGSGYNTEAAINNENAKVAVAINSKMDKAGSTMTGDLDMNSNDILNAKSIGAQSMTLAGEAVTVSNLATTTLPAQAGENGKFLTTNGTEASWDTISTTSVVNVLDYGATGDGATDDSAAIQAAVDAAGVLGKVVFPKADVEYIFGTTIVVDGGQTWEGEVDWSSTRTPTEGMSHLRYTGTTTAISCAEMQWLNMSLAGNVSSAFTTNVGIGIANTGVLRLIGSSIRGFTTGVSSTGGFYHAFDRCSFFHNNVCFDFLIVNNVSFSQCKFTSFDTAVTGSGGAGPLSFSQCSLESWTDKLVSHLAGSAFGISADQCYIENYPTNAIKTGLTDVGGTGNYDLANGFTHGNTMSITDSLISNKGIKRLVLGTAKGITKLQGNYVIMYAASASVPNEMEGIVHVTSQSDMLTMEDEYQFINSSGTATTFAASGIVTPQIVSTVSLGREFSYLDYEGNLISSGHRKISETGDRTLSVEDYGKFIAINKASDAIVTIPTLPLGWFCYIQQESSNPMTFTAGTGLSFLNTPVGKLAATKGKYSIVKVQMSRTNSCTITGDLSQGQLSEAKTGAYTVEASDAGTTIAYNSASGANITIPSGLGAGFGFTLVQQSTGVPTIVASGTTLVGTAATTTAGDIKQVFSIGTDTYAIGN